MTPGCGHGECVEIVGLGVGLDLYRRARAAGCGHGECVEVASRGVSLYWYRLARVGGVWSCRTC